MLITNSYQQMSSLGRTRIDLILEIYSRLLAHLDQGRNWLEKSEKEKAREHFQKIQVGVSALIGGQNAQAGETPGNFARLYEYVLFCLSTEELDKLDSAKKVLLTLQSGFLEIQDQARLLEREGQIPSLDSTSTLNATA